MRISERLTVDHMRTVVTLRETASFTTAARQLGISQSSLSRRVSELESVLGVHVFKRTTRKVELTAVGRQMLEPIATALSSVDQCVERLTELVSGNYGRISIGCIPSLAATLLPGIVREFTAQNDEVHVEVRDALAAQVVSQVKSGVVDVGVTGVLDRDRLLSYEKTGEDEFYCALPSWHKLSNRESLTWEELEAEKWIFFSSHTSISLPVKQSISESGIQLQSTMLGHSVGAVAGLISSGLGVSAVPSLVIPLMRFAELQFVPLVPTFHRDIYLVTRAGEKLSAATQKFLSLVRERTAGLGIHVKSGGEIAP